MLLINSFEIIYYLHQWNSMWIYDLITGSYSDIWCTVLFRFLHSYCALDQVRKLVIPLNKSILFLIWQWGCWKDCYTCENMKLSLSRQVCYLAMSLSFKCDLTLVTQPIVLPTGRGLSLSKIHIFCQWDVTNFTTIWHQPQYSQLLGGEIDERAE